MAIMRVSAYKNIVPLENAAVTPDGYIVDEMGDIVYNAICPILNRGIPHQYKGLEPGVIYQFESTLCFACYSHDQHMNFLETLAQLGGYVPGEIQFAGTYMMKYAVGAITKGEGPFWELMNFSTNRTAIGPEVCAKLAADFQAYRGKALAFDKNNDFEDAFYNQFMNWLEVFIIASDYGMVTLD